MSLWGRAGEGGCDGGWKSVKSGYLVVSAAEECTLGGSRNERASPVGIAGELELVAEVAVVLEVEEEQELRGSRAPGDTA